jgi:hypothetical protein
MPTAALAQNAQSSFRADVMALMTLAMKEAPSDFIAVPLTPGANPISWIVSPPGPSFKACYVTYNGTWGKMTKMLFCEAKPVANGQLAQHRTDILTAAAATGLSAWTKKEDGDVVNWTQDTASFEMEVDSPAKAKTSTLYLGMKITPHVRYSPVGPSVAKFLDVAMAAAPSFDSIPVLVGSDPQGLGIYDIMPAYGETFPYCRKFSTMMECFSPNFAESDGALMDIAKPAVTAALPAGFTLNVCGRNVADELVCTWNGPNKLQIMLLIQPADDKAPGNFMQLSMNQTL